MRALVILLAFLLLASPALAWEAEVFRVADGDTVTVVRTDTGEKIRVRLYGVDTPEGRGRAWEAQPYSRIATNFLKELLPEKSRVSVMDMGFDKYTRTVGGVITLPDGKIVQEELLRAGLAWVYPKYCHDCRQWTGMQEEARAARRGLWRSDKPVAP